MRWRMSEGDKAGNMKITREERGKQREGYIHTQTPEGREI